MQAAVRSLRGHSLTPLTAELKIDRSFIEAMMTDEHTATIVASTIALARNLRIDLVAEGVERIEQLELLRSFDCPVVQGLLLQPSAAG